MLFYLPFPIPSSLPYLLCPKDAPEKALTPAKKPGFFLAGGGVTGGVAARLLSGGGRGFRGFVDQRRESAWRRFAGLGTAGSGGRQRRKALALRQREFVALG